MNLLLLSNAEVHKNREFPFSDSVKMSTYSRKPYFPISVQKPSPVRRFRRRARGLLNCILILAPQSGFCSSLPPYPCDRLSGNGYSVPITVMLLTLPMSMVASQTEVSVTTPF